MYVCTNALLVHSNSVQPCTQALPSISRAVLKSLVTRIPFFCFICFVCLALLFEKFIIRSLNLLRQILRCENYNPPRANLKECKLKLVVLCPLSLGTVPVPCTTAVPPPGVMEAHQAKLAFFKASICQQMLERLVGHYLPLSAEELQSWDDNSEDFGL